MVTVPGHIEWWDGLYKIDGGPVYPTIKFTELSLYGAVDIDDTKIWKEYISEISPWLKENCNEFNVTLNRTEFPKDKDGNPPTGEYYWGWELVYHFEKLEDAVLFRLRF